MLDSSFSLFFTIPHKSVYENVCLPVKISGDYTKELGDHVIDLLDRVGLKGKADEKAINLSGGEKQRVCIARALINSPSVIFADEPTGNLDSDTDSQIESMLFSQAKKVNTTLVIVTHDEDLAMKCDKQITLKDGRIR